MCVKFGDLFSFERHKEERKSISFIKLFVDTRFFLSDNTLNFRQPLMENEQSQTLQLVGRKTPLAYLCVHVCYGKHNMNYRNKHSACLTTEWGKLISSCFEWSQKRSPANKIINTPRTNTISAAAELLVFDLHGVIYFNVKIKNRSIPLAWQRRAAAEIHSSLPTGRYKFGGDKEETVSPQLLQTRQLNDCKTCHDL